MFWPFRRKAGKHQLGAAVTSIPALPRPAAVPQLPIPLYDGMPADSAPAPALETTPAAPVAVPASYEPPISAEPRIELGFRDGSTAALAPGSEQARALSEIASVLTRRD